ncbi:hypothetical protein [Methylobacterium oryzihabitans]|uniref:Calcium-binding protein n=1 Tax=Methylobacterium oryzihabitans TaxID=2499852 RepID=A0A437P9W2_9HYPH|nr:hypothetical protein [Methylobacterium oryzihabitans]RVU19086.1 hypothetical protein EOE48_09320 [Methylobacterium oryzihabitans]
MIRKPDDRFLIPDHQPARWSRRLGDDFVLGQDGDDGLFGGEGGDTIEGGAGSDLRSGNAGDDVLTGGSKADVVIAYGAGDALTLQDVQPGALSAATFTAA